ncbi:LysE family transporter [Streptomyces sp. 8N114]|uniref:LysE family transporter n=1 Tax=Streptomyces sp. 8N114 TaxID=3457419 RepID=UPI003FD5526E
MSSVSDAAVAGLVAGYAVAVPVGALAVLLVSLAARTSLRVGVAGALGVAVADGAYATVAVLGGAAVARAVEPIADPLRWTASAVLVLMAARSARTAVRALRQARAVRRRQRTRADWLQPQTAPPGGGRLDRGSGDRPADGSGDRPVGSPSDQSVDGSGDRPVGSPSDQSVDGSGAQSVDGPSDQSVDGCADRFRDGPCGPAPEAARSVLPGEAALGTPSRAFLGLLGMTLLNPWAIIYFSALTLGNQRLGGTGGPSQVAFVAGIVFASVTWQLLLASSGAALGRALTGPRGRAVTGLASSAIIAALAVALAAGVGG